MAPQDGKDFKVPVRDASRSNSSANLKARLLGGSHGQASSSSSSDRYSQLYLITLLPAIQSVSAGVV